MLLVHKEKKYILEKESKEDGAIIYVFIQNFKSRKVPFCPLVQILNL